MAFAERIDEDLLEIITSDLQAEGYVTYRRPVRKFLPEFLRKSEPDAIAIGKEPKLVIEIVREGAAGAAKIKQLQKALEGQADWQLRVVLDRGQRQADASGATGAEIENAVTNIRSLAASGDDQAALLIAWAAFEALSRNLEPEKFRKPQTPGRLVEILASLGYLRPEDADRLRRLAGTRNALIHGDLSISVQLQDLQFFLRLLESRLASNSEPAGQA
jgi:uncharacterized protein YutE (UPF0331/DUF86 family)